MDKKEKEIKIEMRAFPNFDFHDSEVSTICPLFLLF